MYDVFAYRTKVHQFLHLSLCAVWREARKPVDTGQLSRVIDRIEHEYGGLDELIGILQEVVTHVHV